MVDEYFKKVLTSIIFATLLILSYLLLRPLLVSIILGVILAFIFLPVYNFIYKYSKLKNLSAFSVCLILLTLVILPLWYLTPIVIDQSLKLFLKAQQIDFGEVLSGILPSIMQSETLAKEILPTTGSFLSSATDYLRHSISQFLISIPTIFLYFVVILFTFFFVLKNNEDLVSYIRSLIPFPREVQNRLFKSSGDITISVLYGRIAMGIAQGLIVGIGFFVLKIPNALLLTALAALTGILPIVGTIIVWLPVSIFLFASGQNVIALGIIGFGILATIFESIVQPILLARMVKMNSSIMLVGMIGGLLMFGILGVILGPLILAYLWIIFDLYRNKKTESILIEKR